MNTQELLIRLKRDAEIFSLQQLKAQLKMERASVKESGSEPDPSKMMSLNNVTVMIRLKEREQVDAVVPVDEVKLRKFTRDLSVFMDTYAPERLKLKQYIMVICIYLRFIERKPLHAVGLKMQDDLPLYFDGKYYRCPMKRQNMKDDCSLCGYCVALPYERKNHHLSEL